MRVLIAVLWTKVVTVTEFVTNTMTAVLTLTILNALHVSVVSVGVVCIVACYRIKSQLTLCAPIWTCNYSQSIYTFLHSMLSS